MRTAVLVIDNLDPLTANLIQAMQFLGADVRSLRNTVDPKRALEIAEDTDSLLLLSPGPGRPEEAGCCMELIKLARARVPLFGVCLGHQALVQEAGGLVCRAPEAVHGKASLLEHDAVGPFAGIIGPVQVGRYHSLCTREVPDRFRVHAELDGMVMAISDAEAKQVGLQFHPESILTPAGRHMLRNILRQH